LSRSLAVTQHNYHFCVIPAKAGIQWRWFTTLGPRLRGDDAA
jgi:hypothetical protein